MKERFKFYNKNRVACSISNIAHGNAVVTAYASPVDVYDAVEDAKNSKELLNNLRKLKLVGWYNLSIDRETTEYVRIKGTDTLGNVHYLQAYFD